MTLYIISDIIFIGSEGQQVFVNFENVFNQEKNDKQFKELHERALNEHWCCTCKHCQFEKDGDWCNF